MADIQQADVVGNYLANYYGAQDRVQKRADRQMEMQRQGVMDEQRNQQFQWTKEQHDLAAKTDAISEAVMSLKPGDVQGFEAAKQGLLAKGVITPQEAATLDPAKLQDYQLQSEKWRQIKAFQLQQQQGQAQIDASRASTQHSLAATAALREKPQGGSAMAQNAAERAQLAQALGIDPRSDAGKRYILTGQMPNGLTPADRNAVQDADQKVLATKQGLGMLQQARKLSDQSNQGYGANTLAQIPALLGDKSSLNTIDFDNLLQSQVLPQLKTIFGGAPTEGERAILLELQGSSSMTRENRARILDRAIQMANERLKFYNDQAQGIRGGTYYNPGQGPLAGGQPAPVAAAPVAAPAAPKAPPPPPGFKVIQ